MIPLDEARTRVVGACSPLAPRRVRLGDATSLVLAQDVTAPEDVPPFANSAVDGYAVTVSDVASASREHPVILDVAGEIAAGDRGDVEVRPGTAVRIMTGAPIPAGAEAVVMVEDTTRLDGGRVEIRATVPAGSAIRAAGEDLRAGQFVVAAGTRIRPALAGVLASVNALEVEVIPPVRVAVMSTGDELVDDGSPLQRGQIRESNRTMLLGLVRSIGAEAIDLGIVRDDEAALESVLERAAGTCDAIVTSGGVSMGDYDVVKAVLGRIAEMTWMQIAIKPAKPFAFGMMHRGQRSVPVFGLPGNPVSSLVSFHLLARPALEIMMGRSEPCGAPQVIAVADEDLSRRPDGKVHFQRVRARYGTDGRIHVASVGAQGSHQLAATALAHALAIVPDGEGIRAGSDVTVLLLDDLT